MPAMQNIYLVLFGIVSSLQVVLGSGSSVLSSCFVQHWCTSLSDPSAEFPSALSLWGWRLACLII